MHKLFWRVFISLWVLIISIASVTFAINFTPLAGHAPPGAPSPPILQRAMFALGLNSGMPPGPPPNHNGPMQMSGPGGPPNGLDFRGMPDIVDISSELDQHGIPGVKTYISQLQTKGIELYLFDSDGGALAGNMPSATARNLAIHALRTRMPDVAFENNRMLHANLFSDDNNRTYVLVDSVGPPAIDWPFVILKMLGVMFVASLVCWWLTVQITTPLRILRSAARDIAVGKFDTRIVGQLDGRRDEVGQLASDFDLMAGKLESLNTAQNRLLADISHELRSPLTRLALASALARRTSNSTTSECLDRIDTETERLNDLISQLTALSILELETPRGLWSPVDIGELVASVICCAQYEAKEKQCTINLRSDYDGFCSVYGDHELLRRAIENVVRNAVRYTDDNTVIGVHVRIISITRQFEIAVEDRGPGVASDELESIFNAFYRTSEARDRQSGGVGLGLAIAMQAVQQHDGTISAANNSHRGLTVTIRLPMNQIEYMPELQSDSFGFAASSR